MGEHCTALTVGHIGKLASSTFRNLPNGATCCDPAPEGTQPVGGDPIVSGTSGD
jgi:hypothetical protein